MTELDTAKTIIDITQGIIIILGTIFTVRWTYRTFSHKEKIEELKDLKMTIEQLHWKMEITCAQVRKNPVPDEKEINERMELAQIHNKLVRLAKLNLYTKPEFRKKVQDIVGLWVSNDRLKMMQRREGSEIPEADVQKTWIEFNKEYDEVNEIIDDEAGRLL